MENKNSAVDEFLKGIEGDTPNITNQFQPKDDNPFPEPKVQKEDENNDSKIEGEDTQTTRELKPEEKVPFHKDPKVQRFIEKEVERLTKGMSPKEAQKVEDKINESDDVVAAFTEIIGNDTPQKVTALSKLSNVLKSFEHKAGEATRKIEEEKIAQREAEEELERGLTSIEESYENVDITSETPSARKMRTEYLDFVMKIAPKDSSGQIVAYPDFRETFRLFHESKKKVVPSNAKNREIAARSMSNSSEASSSTPSKGQSWKDVERHFEKIKS